MSILRDFVLCWDESQEQYYAFRSITGETIYGATEEGDVTGLDRSLSAWRRPYEDQPNALNIPVFSNDESTELWGRQRPMSDEAAMQLWEKHYDFGTGFFFYISKQDNTTLWTKPSGISPNLPCDDLLQENMPMLLESTDENSNTIIEQEQPYQEQEQEISNPDVWTEMYEEGIIYWYNEITGESTYDDPYALALVNPETIQEKEIESYDESIPSTSLEGYEENIYQNDENVEVEVEEEEEEEIAYEEDNNNTILPDIYQNNKTTDNASDNNDLDDENKIEKKMLSFEPFGKDINHVKTIRKRRTDKTEPCHIRVRNFKKLLTGGRLKGNDYNEMYEYDDTEDAHNGLSRHYGRKTPYKWPEVREDPGPGGDADEGKLPWITTRPLKQSLPPLQFLDQGSLHHGPYIRRRGVGKQMVRAIHRLPNQSYPEDKVNLAAFRGDRLFINAGDVNYEDWQLGDSLTYFDGKVCKGTSLEPMTLCRAAYEDGPEALVEMMSKFLDREDVQLFGLINLAKYEYKETGHGEANVGGLETLRTCLQVMKAYPDNEAIQGRALMVLSQLSDNYAMRREMFKVDWVTPCINAMNNNQENVNEMWVDHGGDRGKVKMIIKEPTRHSIDTCTWACKLFSQMACDNEKRPLVADDGIPLFLLAMKTCPLEGIVQINAIKGIYNCIYRCESAHIIATEEDALSICEELLISFSSDPQLLLLAQRTIRALQPDGWRGSADDPSSVIPKPIKYELSELSEMS